MGRGRYDDLIEQWCKQGYTEDEIDFFLRGDMYEATHGADGKPLGSPGRPDPFEKPPANDNKNPPNPKQRFGDMKAAVQLVPPALMIHAAKGNKEGVLKGYGPFNWRVTKVEAMTYIGAILRHAFAWMDGEEIDPESVNGKHHLDGLAASLGILLDAMDGGFLIDNRPPKGPAPGLLRMPTGAK